MAGKSQNGNGKPSTGKWLLVIGILIALWLVSMIVAGALSIFFGSSSESSAPIGRGNIAVIPIKGEIFSEKTTSILSGQTASADEVLGFLDTANSDPSVKAIILDIDSPGGSPVASEEMMDAVKNSSKYTVAVIRDIGTSGAYWVASGADEIMASRLSLTGSIGVYSSYLDFAGTMAKYGVSYQRLVGGDLKDIGSPYRNMTPEEEKIFQSKIDMIHTYFLHSVAVNRNLSDREIAIVKNGQFFTGEEAKDNGLIDNYGSISDAVSFIEQKLNITGRTVQYQEKQGFLSSLMSAMSKPAFYVGQGIGYALRDTSLQSVAPSIKT